MEYACSDYIYKLNQINKDQILLTYVSNADTYVLILDNGKPYVGCLNKKVDRSLFSPDTCKKMKYDGMCELQIMTKKFDSTSLILPNLTKSELDIWLSIIPKEVIIQNTKIVSNAYMVSYKKESMMYTKCHNNNTVPISITYRRKTIAIDPYSSYELHESYGQNINMIDNISVYANNILEKCAIDLTDDDFNMFIPVNVLKGSIIEIDKTTVLKWTIKTPYVGTLTYAGIHQSGFAFTDDYRRTIVYASHDMEALLPLLIGGTINGEFNYVDVSKSRKIRYILTPRIQNDSLNICLSESSDED